MTMPVMSLFNPIIYTIDMVLYWSDIILKTLSIYDKKQKKARVILLNVSLL